MGNKIKIRNQIKNRIKNELRKILNDYLAILIAFKLYSIKIFRSINFKNNTEQ